MSKIISLPIEKYTLLEDTTDLARARVNVYHEGYNPNGSYFEPICFENSKDSFINKPICCSYRDEDDDLDFGEHDEDELPVGVVPETNNYKVEEINNIKWASVDCIIFKEYCEDAYKLLKEGKKISMEIEVLDGFMGDDGFYHIKQFNLLCITILGDNYSPAMGDNATITLFNNINSDKFAMKFSEIINKVNSIVEQKNSTEGGNKVNRDEIIKRFSFASNIEGYQAIIDNKDLSDEDLEKQLFTLSQYQIEEFIREKLSSEKIIRKYWDGEAYETEKYYLEDTIPSDNIAILWSREDYKNYGVEYSFNGDNVEIDFKKCKRYIRGDWREFNEGEKEPINIFETFSNEIIEKAQEEINSIKDSFKVEETEEYKNIKTELDNTKVEFTTLQSDKTALDEEVKILKEFKETKEKEEKENEVNSVLEEFAQLKEIDGYEDIIKDKFSITKEELTDKLKIFAFDNGITINKKQTFSNKAPKEPTAYKHDNIHGKDEYVGIWNILDNYKK